MFCTPPPHFWDIPLKNHTLLWLYTISVRPKGVSQNKLIFLADKSVQAFSLPSPLGLGHNEQKCNFFFFFMYTNFIFFFKYFFPLPKNLHFLEDNVFAPPPLNGHAR